MGLTADRIATIRQGQRYRAKVDLDLRCSLYWDAPFSGGGLVVFPKGEILIVQLDPVSGASAVDCLPEKYEELRPALLKEYLHEKFTSYSLCVSFGTLLDDCELIGSVARKRRRKRPRNPTPSRQ
jgi:hypothetical protein